MSNLSQLTAVQMSGSLDDYKPVRTIPQLQQLNFDFHRYPEDFPDPPPPICNTGFLSGLTKLEIDSCLVLKQVR